MELHICYCQKYPLLKSFFFLFQGLGLGVGGLGLGVGGLGLGVGGLGYGLGARGLGLGVGGLGYGLGHGAVIAAPVLASPISYATQTIGVAPVKVAALTAGSGSIAVSAHGAAIRGPPTVPVVVAGPSGKIAADGLWGPTANVGQGYGHGW